MQSALCILLMLVPRLTVFEQMKKQTH